MVERYNLETVGGGMCDMCEARAQGHPGGRYVTYDDYHAMAVRMGVKMLELDGWTVNGNSNGIKRNTPNGVEISSINNEINKLLGDK